jgi:hypothetical protein
MAGILLAAIAGTLGRHPDDSVGDSAASSQSNSSAPGQVATHPVQVQGQNEVTPALASEKPLSPADRRTAEKRARETYAIETQKDLWRQGIETTFQARGTTLFVRNVLAGDAFKFQFQEQFIAQNRNTLKELGFTRVELTNDDTMWSWNLKN